MSFDEIFDLTAGVYFNFYNIYIYIYIYVVRDKKHIIVCGRTRTYLLRSLLLAREYTPYRFVRICLVPPSGPRGCSHSQCCCVNFSGAVIVTTTTFSSFKSCVLWPHLYPCMYVHLYRTSINKCTTMIPTTIDTVGILLQ